MGELFCIFVELINKYMEYKIYCLKEEDTSEIRYIGVTIRELRQRLSQHIHTGKKKTGTRISKWIQSLLNKGKHPVIELIEICDENTWEEREKFWISQYDNLTNIHCGGKGVVIDRSKSSIQRSAVGHYKKVVQLDKNGNLIKLWDSASVAAEELEVGNTAILNAIKNYAGCMFVKKSRWMFLDSFERNEFKFMEYKSNKIKQNPELFSTAKHVYMYDLNGNFIRKFYSVARTIQTLFPGTKTETSLREALKKRTSNKNFYFSYDYFDKLEIPKKYRIVKLDSNLNPIKFYCSQKEAEIELNVGRCSLSDYIRGQHNHLYKGYYWYYVKDYENNKI
ncbi:MAG: hypothetical protein EHM93_19780 [Bacteroidales bacterium]|nr:MAG: hypothetical protein EHM93_19780 [Bacteroidales bacterium]